MANRVLEVVVKVKDQASSKLAKFSGNVKGSTKALKAMGAAAAVAAVAVIAAAVKMVDVTKKQVAAAIKLGDEYDKMGKRIDVSVDSLSEWIFIIERAGGSSATLEAAFKGLITQMKGVKDGTKLSVDAFKDLGVEVYDSSGEMRKAEDVFNDAVVAIGALSSTTEQAAYSQQLFGKGGMKLLPVLRQTSDEIQHQKELAQELGLVYSQEFTDGAAAMNDALDLLRKGAGGFGRDLVEAFGSDAAILIETLAVEVSTLFDVFKIGGEDTNDIMFEVAATLDSILNSITPALAGMNAIKQVSDLTVAMVPGPAMIKGAYDAIKSGGSSVKEEINDASDAVKNFQLIMEGRGSEGSTDRFVETLIARRKAIKALREEKENFNEQEKEQKEDRPEEISAPTIFDAQVDDMGIDEVFFEDLDRIKIAREEAAEADMVAGLASMDRYHDEMDALADLADAEEEAYNNALQAAEAMGRVGETTVQALLRGENAMKAFGNVIKNEVINAISAAIAKMIILKSLMSLTGGGSSIMDIFGGVKDGGTAKMAAGGAARMVAGGNPGMDSVPALLMPGETVITRNDTLRLQSFLASWESSSMVDPAALGGGSGGGVAVSLNVARPVNHMDMMDLGRAAVVAGQQVAEANL